MEKKNFDWGMHYFRAFAILSIMGCHYSGCFGYAKLVNVALTSCTIFFLFISGYLCQFIDSKRRDTPLAYYKKKLLNVICPFILFSIGCALLKGFASFSWEFVVRILCGRCQAQYWYIPFVSILFLVSPLICRLTNRNLILTTVISFVLFILFPYRPWGFSVAWPAMFFNYTFFSVFYLVGFVYCRFKNRIDDELNRYWPIFAVFAVLGWVLLAYPQLANLQSRPMGIVMSVQRFSVLIVALVGLTKLKDRKIVVLDLMAQYSFTLYFIHFGLFAFTRPIHAKLVAWSHLPTILAEPLVFCVYVAAMMFGTLMAKKVLGKYSRMILGS